MWDRLVREVPNMAQLSIRLYVPELCEWARYAKLLIRFVTEATWVDLSGIKAAAQPLSTDFPIKCTIGWY